VTELYWVAIRGAAVPSYALPVDEPTMRRAIVMVGSFPAEETVWLFGPPDTDLGRSNYDMLIGYRSPAAQQAGIAVLLYGTYAKAKAEVRRALREETVILGGAGAPPAGQMLH